MSSCLFEDIESMHGPPSGNVRASWPMGDDGLAGGSGKSHHHAVNGAEFRPVSSESRRSVDDANDPHPTLCPCATRMLHATLGGCMSRCAPQ